MTTDVLVIHGVANRDPAAFEARVRQLETDANAAGKALRLVGAFWGHLGGEGANLPDTLPPGIAAVRGQPHDALVEHIYAIRRAAGIEVRSEDELVGLVVEGARQRVRIDVPAPAFEVRGGEEDEDVDTAFAIAEAVRGSAYIRGIADPEIARAIGQVIGASLTASPTGEFDTRARIFTPASRRDIARRVVKAIDDFLGALTGEALGALNQAARRALSTAAALSLGDILAFRHATNGAAIRQAVIDALRETGVDAAKPLVVVAHSLGGLIAVEMALAGQLRCSHLVTVGSQPAMFHVMKPLEGLAPYAPGKPTPIPAGRIGRWTNLWHPLDPLSFVAAPIFVLPGGTVHDVEVHTPLSTILADRFWMHSAYWECKELVEALP